MKKLILIFLAVLIAAAIGGVAYVMAVTGIEPAGDDFLQVSAQDLAPLPADEPAAKKALQGAKDSLARLQRSKPYIVIDTHADKIYLRGPSGPLLEAVCSTGSGGEYVDDASGRRWVFDTPRGVFKVQSRLTDPWWRKPDWAFLEEGEEIPNSESERLDPNMMGKYALGIGDGYFIHGTIYERLLGVNVTHGCVRVGTDDLERLFNQAPMGTYVYIF